MSQSGLLSEAELPEQIYKYFDLKLDKEAFLNPSKEVVIEIYTRFLDKIGIDWTKSSESDLNDDKHPTMVKARMLSWLRFIFSRFDIEFEVNMGDILMPTRKRTTVFLNVLILIRAQFEARWSKYQQLEAQRAEQLKKEDELRRQIAELRLETEELALRVGQSETVETIKENNKNLSCQIELIKVRTQNILKEYDGKKRAIAASEEEIEKARKRNADLDEKIEAAKAKKELKTKEQNLKDFIENKRRKMKDLELTTAIKVEEIKAQRQKLINETNKSMQAKIGKISELKKNNEDIDRRLGRLSEDQDKRSKYTQSKIDEATKMFENFKSRYEASRQVKDDGRKFVLEHKAKLDSVLGNTRSVLNDTAKDRTYVKSTRSD